MEKRAVHVVIINCRVLIFYCKTRKEGGARQAGAAAILNAGKVQQKTTSQLTSSQKLKAPHGRLFNTQVSNALHGALFTRRRQRRRAPCKEKPEIPNAGKVQQKTTSQVSNTSCNALFPRRRQRRRAPLWSKTLRYAYAC